MPIAAIPAIVAGASAGIGAIGAAKSSKAQKNAAVQAAQIQADAQNRATQAQQQMYDTTRSDLSPYRQQGTTSIADLMYLTTGRMPTEWTGGDNALGASYANYKAPTLQASPMYQWQTQEYDRNMNKQLNALGRRNSTYGMDSYGRGLQELGANESNQQYNRVANLATMGQSAAGLQATSNQNTGNALSTIAMNSGNQQATNALYNGAAKASLYSGLGNLIPNALSIYKGYR